MKKGTVPCFLFQLLFQGYSSLQQGRNDSRIMKQLVSESTSKKQRELNLCSQRLSFLWLRLQLHPLGCCCLHPAWVFTPLNSCTEPLSQLCPEVYQHLDSGSVKTRTLSTTYVVGQKRNKSQKISHFFNLKNVEFNKRWSFPDTWG